MEKRPPRRPRVAWAENVAPQESSSAAEPAEVTTVQPLQPNAVYGQEAMDFIQAFASSPDQLQDEDLKLKFLDSICTLCRAAKDSDSPQDLDVFCHKYKLGAKIQVLLQLEPKYEICTEVRRLAMLAIAGLRYRPITPADPCPALCAHLPIPPGSPAPVLQETLRHCSQHQWPAGPLSLCSTLGTVLKNRRKLLRLCFDSIFFLPPSGEMWSREASLYSQVLLHYCLYDTVAVQERVMGRIRLLSHLLADSSTVQAGQTEDSGAASRHVRIPVLGKLLGHLFFKLFRKEETSLMALDILCFLLTFLSEQKCATPPAVRAQLPAYWQSEITSLLDTPSTWRVQAFGRYLRPAERTGIVLAAIEILGCSSLLDKKVPMEFLEVAMESPQLWLMDVPKIVRHIFEYCDETNAATAHSFPMLLVLMASKWPRRVVTTAVEVAPISCDEVYHLWKAMFSVRRTLEKVLRELHIQLQDQHKDIFTQQEKSCLAFLAMLASDDVQEQELGLLYKDLNLLRCPIIEMVSLVLRALLTLSERAKTARKMKGLLSELLKFLWHRSGDVSVMVMDIVRNVLGHLKEVEASTMAVKVVPKLWHLFDAEEDFVREHSIRLFRDLLGKTDWKDKAVMKKYAWKALVQLFLHMSDEAPSVAKASAEAILAVAKLLKWKELKQLAQAEQTWRMGKCLLAKDSSRAEQFVLDSQRYLRSPQAPMREAALRFIGLAARHLTEQSEDTVAEVLWELDILKAGDKDPAIHSLAAQTSQVLTSPRKQRRSGFSLRALCCWCL
ncbi:uncharacterized protein LOC121661569 isoform X2 [Corvus kubaryi]|uniref:uncharacterized protein LOC121661569 isoform X2 n=1 Tax=Corvus kubaryi TaxID=68294 RepID=UPI001C04DE57|nr:uncharacterized protein LOC121661569 isoform X2 [Corvus kubaryi]